MLAVAAWRAGCSAVCTRGTGSRANTAVRVAGFVLLLVASCALDDAALAGRAACARAPAAWSARLVGNGLAAGLNFLGATLLLHRRLDGRTVARLRRLLAHRHGSAGRLPGRASRWLRERWPHARDAAEGRERRQARKEAVQTEQKKSATRAPPRIEPPRPIVEKSARVERERQVPLFDPPKAQRAAAAETAR